MSLCDAIGQRADELISVSLIHIKLKEKQQLQ
jgi:hypothetical protein